MIYRNNVWIILICINSFDFQIIYLPFINTKVINNLKVLKNMMLTRHAANFTYKRLSRTAINSNVSFHPAAILHRPMMFGRSTQLAAFSTDQQHIQDDDENSHLTSKQLIDNVIFHIQNKCQTVEKLQEYEQEMSQKLTNGQRSFVLARMRTLLAKQGESMSTVQRLSAQSAYQNTIRALMRNVQELDVQSVSSTLALVSKGNKGIHIDVQKPDPSKLLEVEQLIVKQFESYMMHDISVVLSSLMKLGHNPKLLMELINRQANMSTFSKDQCVRILEALVEDSEARSKSFALKLALFDKFFLQLEKHAQNFNSYNICRALACLESLTKMEQILSSKAQCKSLQMRATFLTERLTDMLSRESDVAVLDLYWSNKFCKDIEKALTSKLGSQVGYIPLDLRKLQLYSVQELQDHLNRINPKIIVNMLQLFENERHRSTLVQKTLEGLRNEKIDIRTFPQTQLAKFVEFVSIYQPSDVKVFFNYVVTAFDSGFYTMTKQNFVSMSQIFFLFVKNGFLSPDHQNKFFFSYLVGLKKTMYPGGGKEHMLDSRDIIKVTWSLIAMLKPGKMQIPLLPKLLEQLSKFDRPDQPLNQEELVMLHQINVYVKDLVSQDKLPSQFLELFPEQVTLVARHAYEAWDQHLYPEVQKEIAMKLLQLRVEFIENVRPLAENPETDKSILNQFKVPIRLSGDGKVIILTGEHNVNRDTEQWHGLHGFTIRMLQSGLTSPQNTNQRRGNNDRLDVNFIDVDEWKGQDEIGKMEMLSSFVQRNASAKTTKAKNY